MTHGSLAATSDEILAILPDYEAQQARIDKLTEALQEFNPVRIGRVQSMDQARKLHNAWVNAYAALKSCGAGGLRIFGLCAVTSKQTNNNQG